MCSLQTGAALQEPRVDGGDAFLGRLAQPVSEVSSAGESHPHALAEPYVNVSAHTAPAVEPRRTPICQWANNPGSRREIRAIQCAARRL
jgi:hypothetical protein